MASNSYEGMRLILKDDYEISITPNMKEVDLDSWDVEKILLRYEERHCGCCEGSHEIMELNPDDLFEFIDAGGIKKITELSISLDELKTKNKNLETELKKYKEVIGELKNDTAI